MKAQGKTISFDPNLRPVLWKSEAEMVEKLNRLAFQADWVCRG
jgi:2-dehydro-3-deoxygluconokinase